MSADRESTVPKPEFVNVFDMRKVTDVLKAAEEDRLSLERSFDQAKTLSFEKFDCPMCKSLFMSRLECVHHISLEHPLAPHERPLFCDVRAFMRRGGGLECCRAAINLRAGGSPLQSSRRCMHRTA